MIGNTHVPDKLEGFLLQARHALYELISLDERIVSVEAYDDVAVEKDESVIAEQIKSVLSSNNPVSNRAESFWKTIYNWCNYIKDDTLPKKELVLKYVVISSHPLNAGTIPNSFAEAKTSDEAREALEKARTELFGNEGTQTKKPLRESLKTYVDFCFAPENEDIVLKVISIMEIDIHEDSYDENLLKKFKMQNIPQEYDKELFDSMLGWVDNQIHLQIKQNKPAYISSKDYRAALDIQMRSRDRKIIWSAVSVQPKDYQTTAEVERRDTYIRQLELINIDVSDILEAASDFLRTRAEKTAWAEKGLVNEGSFSEYYDGLLRIWKTQKLLSDSVASDDVGKGKFIYAHCKDRALTQRLLGSDVPGFFGSGSLQALANEPAKHPAIGWHPRYGDLLMGDDKNDE